MSVKLDQICRPERFADLPGAAMKYKVVLYRSDEGVSVSVPALPGCWSEGDTEAEALENIQDAILEYLAAIEDRTKSEESREVEVLV